MRVSELYKTLTYLSWQRKATGSVFVLDFYGFNLEKRIPKFKREVSAVIDAWKPGDLVVIRIESYGGCGDWYSECAGEIFRLHARNIPVTFCIDQIAASGGYFLACMGNRIVAKPYAIIGSIGVVSQLSDCTSLFTKLGIDIQVTLSTPGKYLESPFLPICEYRKAQQLERNTEHFNHFKEHVQLHRPSLDIDKVATGNVWRGKKACELGLIDAVNSSEDELRQLEAAGFEIFYVLCVKFIEKPAEEERKSIDPLQIIIDELADLIVRFTSRITS